MVNVHDLSSQYQQDVEALLGNEDFLQESSQYVLNEFPTRKTVDLFVTVGEKHINEGGDMKFLTIDRDEFPKGSSLP